VGKDVWVESASCESVPKGGIQGTVTAKRDLTGLPGFDGGYQIEAELVNGAQIVVYPDGDGNYTCNPDGIGPHVQIYQLLPKDKVEVQYFQINSYECPAEYKNLVNLWVLVSNKHGDSRETKGPTNETISPPHYVLLKNYSNNEAIILVRSVFARKCGTKFCKGLQCRPFPSTHWVGGCRGDNRIIIFQSVYVEDSTLLIIMTPAQEIAP